MRSPYLKSIDCQARIGLRVRSKINLDSRAARGIGYPKNQRPAHIVQLESLFVNRCDLIHGIII